MTDPNPYCCCDLHGIDHRCLAERLGPEWATCWRCGKEPKPVEAKDREEERK
jgi:hypothetical protein